MCWSEQDCSRFAGDAAVLLLRERDAEDALEKLIEFVESPLHIYGVPFGDGRVAAMLGRTLSRFTSKRWRDFADRLPLGRPQFLATVIAEMTAGIIDANEKAIAAWEAKRRQR